jgi:hypothetical protein
VIPLANVEVPEVMLSAVACTPPANVLVADPVTVSRPVEKFVEVALVVVLFVRVVFWRVVEPVMRRFPAV